MEFGGQPVTATSCLGYPAVAIALLTSGGRKHEQFDW